MQNEFWLEKWKKKEIGFHQTAYNRKLTQYLKLTPHDRVLVPLCGKSLDMRWILEQGAKVVGIELSTEAVQAFFEENNLAYKHSQMEQVSHYQGKNIDLYCGDMLSINPKIFGAITTIYDRAAMIALPPEMRQHYCAQINAIAKLQNTPIEMLLLTIDYPQEKVPGPPFSVSLKEIEKHYGQQWEIDVLEAQQIEKGFNPRFQDIDVIEYAIKLRSF